MPQHHAKPQHTIVFDLDGTLVNTAPDLVGALNALFEREGIEQLPYLQARQFIGAGARKLIERGLAAKGRTAAAAEADRLYSDFVSSYDARIAELSRPFPGLESALDALAARGFRLAVCTNKLERLSIKVRSDLRAGYVRRAETRSTHSCGDRRGGGRELAVDADGRRLRYRHRNRARGERADHRRRFRLHRYAGRGPRPQPADQPLRRALVCGDRHDKGRAVGRIRAVTGKDRARFSSAAKSDV